MLNKLDKFHKTRIGFAVFALVELALAYMFISWAIDDGNWFDYLFALLFTVGFLQNLIHFVHALLPKPRRR
ncbi:hypothetical protein BH09PAT3_BH09PAT3_6940 [soil metagenome]